MNIRSEIQKLIDKNRDAQETLDELVTEEACQIAAATNNDGLKSQLEFLEGRGWSETDILAHIEVTLEDIRIGER